MTVWKYPNLSPSWNVPKGTVIKGSSTNGNLLVNDVEVPVYDDSQTKQDIAGKAKQTDLDTTNANVASNTSSLATNAKKQKTISLNLADYGDFSILADYADITTVVQAALNTLPSLLKGTTGWRLFNVSVFIPGGHWTISQKRIFDLSNYGSFPSVRGFNIYGAGFENTEIVFDSNIADADNYLIYNNDNFGYSEIANIRFTSKNNTEKFMYNISTTSGNAASFVFKNMTLQGFKEGIKYDGIIMCSEIDYQSVKFINVPSGGWGIYCNNPQSVNHNFFACEFESIFGTGIEFAKGGCANFYGGSFIPGDGGVIFKTSDNTGSGVGTSNHTFNFYGIRSEMNGTSKLFDIANNTELSFDGCNLTVEKSSVGTTRGIIGPNRSYLSFRNCHNLYKYEVRVDGNVYTNGPCRVHFDTCSLADSLANLVVINGSVSGNTSGLPLIDAINTRYPQVSAGQKTIFDVAVNKETTNLSPVIPVKSVFLRSGVDSNQGLPNNTAVTFTLPLNAIITKIRIVHNVSNLVGTCNYDVKDYLGTTVFATLGATAQTVFATGISADLWYPVNTEAKRTIQVVQGGTNVTQNGYIVVDYI